MTCHCFTDIVRLRRDFLNIATCIAIFKLHLELSFSPEISPYSTFIPIES